MTAVSTAVVPRCQGEESSARQLNPLPHKGPRVPKQHRIRAGMHSIPTAPLRPMLVHGTDSGATKEDSCSFTNGWGPILHPFIVSSRSIVCVFYPSPCIFSSTYVATSSSLQLLCSSLPLFHSYNGSTTGRVAIDKYRYVSRVNSSHNRASVCSFRVRLGLGQKQIEIKKHIEPTIIRSQQGAR